MRFAGHTVAEMVNPHVAPSFCVELACSRVCVCRGSGFSCFLPQSKSIRLVVHTDLITGVKTHVNCCLSLYMAL